jgi:catalase-peroxidase
MGQKFQHDLPPAPREDVNMDPVQVDLHQLMNMTQTEHQFIRLAYQCASTFRATDYQGGCNGGRIRFPPGIDWPINKGLNDTILLLEPIKTKYGNDVSYADLFVLAGNVALERLYDIPKLSFCPGRTDDVDGRAWKSIEYGISDYPTSVEEMIELLHRRGQSYKDFVALTFPLFQSITTLKNVLSGSYNDISSSSTMDHHKLLFDAIQYIPEIRYWAEHIASSSNDVYVAIFSDAWTRLMNADRFDGPIGNICT